LLTAIATLGLIAIGGLVTSKGVGMAVPDWPTSYGYNMFALPFSLWFTGGIFHEHTHRQWASVVGVLVVILTRWLGGQQSRRPLLIIGAVELLSGVGFTIFGGEWRNVGGFLSGIGGVVLLAGVVWAKNAPAARPLPVLGWSVFWLVQLQGLFGGLRVVLDAHVFAGTRLGMWFGLFHGCLAQGFFLLLCVIALYTSKWWPAWREQPQLALPGLQALRPVLFITTGLIFLQLVLGATMRHQHAGLAIPDFPLAYGKLWPGMDADSIQRYNQQRLEVMSVNPITAAQVGLQMVHRLMACMILIGVAATMWLAMRGLPTKYPLRRLAGIWLGLILTQIALGAWTIWSTKAADVATAHVAVGALSLVTGALGCIIAFRRPTTQAQFQTSTVRASAVSSFGVTSATVAGN
jgi:cytochrome c oxidase assembly protein subunit 15